MQRRRSTVQSRAVSMKLINDLDRFHRVTFRVIAVNWIGKPFIELLSKLKKGIQVVLNILCNSLFYLLKASPFQVLPLPCVASQPHHLEPQAGR